MLLCIHYHKKHNYLQKSKQQWNIDCVIRTFEYDYAFHTLEIYILKHPHSDGLVWVRVQEYACLRWCEEVISCVVQLEILLKITSQKIATDEMNMKQHMDSVYGSADEGDFFVTCFCYPLIAKPGNKIGALSWVDPYDVVIGIMKLERTIDTCGILFKEYRAVIMT